MPSAFRCPACGAEGTAAANENQPMKTYIKNLFPLPALIAGLGLIPAGRVTAQTFTTLHSFMGGYGGAYPDAGLILSANTLYGTTHGGGIDDEGTVFAVNNDGTGFTIVLFFTGFNSGSSPQAGLILSGSTLYGTAVSGGSSGNGTVFAVNTSGTGFTKLHNFTALSNSTNSDGANPVAGLILSGNTLYGTAAVGGSSGHGTVFAVNTNGTGFTTLYSFTAGHYNSSGDYYTNSDGVYPRGLVLSGNTLYGTAGGGGSSGNGTVFAVNTNAMGFTNLHSFTARSGSYPYTNSDGATPYAGLILSGNTLYGTAAYGGSSGNGTVFAVNTDGTGFTNLHSFNWDSDGANPKAELILSGNTLYGTTSSGGSSGGATYGGTVFAVNTDGTGFVNLHSFNYSDGANLYAGLILSGNTLYGTAFYGGSSAYGTVISLTLDPAPVITGQPVSQTNTVGTNVTFTVSVSGAAPIFYQWLKNSTNLPNAGNVSGANTNVLTVSNVTLTDAGTYSVVVSNSFGSSTSSNAILTVIQFPTLSEALDATSQTWNTGGNANWSPEIDTTHDGVDAAQSGGITHSQSSWVETSVTGSGTLTFWWKVSSESGYDFFDFYTNGVSASAISGEVDWQQKTFNLAVGSQTLRWTYSKDSSVSSGQDRGWLDQVVFTSSASSPIPIRIQSGGNSSILSWTNSAFTLQSAPAVTGTYTNIPGATSPYTNPITGTQKFYRLSQ
jgi:uncharacterized repeat protein (TIGR03803 family)